MVEQKNASFPRFHFQCRDMDEYEGLSEQCCRRGVPGDIAFKVPHPRNELQGPGPTSRRQLRDGNLPIMNRLQVILIPVPQLTEACWRYCTGDTPIGACCYWYRERIPVTNNVPVGPSTKEAGPFLPNQQSAHLAMYITVGARTRLYHGNDW